MTTGERIQEAMDTAGLKAVDLAKACGISESAVSQWFKGTTKSPTPENIFAIADATGFHARWLATGQGIKRAPRAFSKINGGRIDTPGQKNPDAMTRALEVVGELESEIKLPGVLKGRILLALHDHISKSGDVDAETVKMILKVVI